MTSTTPATPEEKLPDPVPAFAFFMPNFIGILLALILESFQVESKVAGVVPASAHPYALMGLGAAPPPVAAAPVHVAAPGVITMAPTACTRGGKSPALAACPKQHQLPVSYVFIRVRGSWLIVFH